MADEEHRHTHLVSNQSEGLATLLDLDKEREVQRGGTVQPKTLSL